MVVERELEFGQAAGDGWARADRFEPPSELVTEIAEPAPGDEAGAGGWGIRYLGLLIQKRGTDRPPATPTRTGSEPISAPPPAQRPISANGRASSRTSNAAASGASVHGSGTRTAVCVAGGDVDSLI